MYAIIKNDRLNVKEAMNVRVNSQISYPTVFLGKYTVPSTSKPNDIALRVPIEWLIVDRDAENKKALLVSKYALDWELFGSFSKDMTDHLGQAWEKSVLRKLLNDNFYKNSFSSKEKEMILPTTNKAGSGSENRIVDNVFLLDVEAVERYFCAPNTAIALEPMILSDLDETIDVDCSPIACWTMTSGSETDYIVCVDCDGSFCEIAADSDEIGVRPAMWVKL